MCASLAFFANGMNVCFRDSDIPVYLLLNLAHTQHTFYLSPNSTQQKMPRMIHDSEDLFPLRELNRLDGERL